MMLIVRMIERGEGEKLSTASNRARRPLLRVENERVVAVVSSSISPSSPSLRTEENETLAPRRIGSGLHLQPVRLQGEGDGRK